MKKSLFALAAMASLGLFSFGCGDGQDGDACFTALDCDAEQGLVCDTHDATCKKADACYTKKGKFCDAGYKCQESNGECIVEGSAAETCHTNGDDCGEHATCVQDNEGAWGCMPEDAECVNGTVWNNSVTNGKGGKGGCIPEEDEVQTCEDGSNESCDEGYVCEQDYYICVPKQVSNDPKPYKYVKIDDLSPAEYNKPNKEDPGVDIDAVVLTKKGSGQKVYASSVVSYERGDGQSSVESRRAYVPEEILGAPDSFAGYPSDMENCKYYKGTVPANDDDLDNFKFTFVSLGGEGGHIIVGMGGNIEEGDTLDIVELSDCKLENTKSSNGNKAVAEDVGMRVQVSAGSKIGSEWTVVANGTATAGILSATIPELAVVYDDGTDE